MRVTLVLAFVTVRAIQTHGNIFNSNFANSQVVLLAPATDKPQVTCLHVPHTYFYTGTVFLPRLYSSIVTDVRFMTIGGGVIDIDFAFYEDKLRNDGDEQVYSPRFSEETTSEGAFELELNPGEEHDSLSNDAEFLKQEPAVVSEVCLTNREPEEKKVALTIITKYKDYHVDAKAVAQVLPPAELVEFLQGYTAFLARELQDIKPGILSDQELRTQVYTTLVHSELDDDTIEKVRKHSEQEASKKSVYWKMTPSTEIVYNKIQDMHLLMEIIRHNEDRRQAFAEKVATQIDTYSFRVVCAILVLWSVVKVCLIRNTVSSGLKI